MLLPSVIRAPDGQDISYAVATEAPGSPYNRIATGNLFNIRTRGYATAIISYYGSYSGHAYILEGFAAGTGWKEVQPFVHNRVLASSSFGGSSDSETVVAVTVAGCTRLRGRITIAPTVGEMCATVLLVPMPLIQRVDGQAMHGHAAFGRPVRFGLRVATTAPVSTSLPIEGRTSDAMGTAMGATLVYPYSIPQNTLFYSTGSVGITNTTPVTVQPAAAAGYRHYCKNGDVLNLSAVASFFLIRNGSGGPTLHRGYIGPNSYKPLVFDPPIFTSAAALLEVVMLTTGTETYFNFQSWIAP